MTYRVSEWCVSNTISAVIKYGYFQTRREGGQLARHRLWQWVVTNINNVHKYLTKKGEIN